MTRRPPELFSLLACEQRPVARHLIALILLCALAFSSSAGTLRTVDGQTVEGDLRLESNQVIVTRPGKAAVKVDLDNLLSADFSTPISAKSPSKKDKDPEAPLTKLPAEWRSVTVGAAAPGHATLSAGKWIVHGAGNNIAAQADTFFFLCRELKSDAQLVARLEDVHHAAPGAKVGLMLRASTDRGAPNALLAVVPGEGFLVSSRTEQGGNTSRATALEEAMPNWLRITRAGNTITAYKAVDGANWTQIGKPIDLPLDDAKHPLIGLAVCSHDPDADCGAVFQAVRLIPNLTDVPSTNLTAAPPPEPVADGGRGPAAVGDMSGRAVVLRNGTILNHATVHSADAKTVNLVTENGQAQSLAATDVARIILAPATPAQLAKIPPKTAGVLLARGDFLESEFESLEGGKVKMNSVVFGPSSLAAGAEALVIVLRDAVTIPTPWLVRTNDGFAYAARSARIEGVDLLIEDDSNKSIKIPSGNLASIRSGSARFDSLTDLPSTDAAPTPVPANTTLAKHVIEKPLAGSPLTYNVAGKYRLFTCHAGIPDSSLPTLAVKFVVLADSKEIYHSPARTSLDEPLTISLDITNAKSLTLRIDPANSLPLPATGMWADPVLIK